MTSSTLLSLRLSLMLSAFIPLSLAFYRCDEGPCPKGHFLEHDVDGSPVCQPCRPDTYLDQGNHMCDSCFRCMEVKDYNHERTLKECTPDADRVVVCKEGYFRVPDGDPKVSGFCEKCTRCPDDEIVAKKCGLYSDTVCFKHPVTQGATEHPVTQEATEHPVTAETLTDGSQAGSTLEDGLQDQNQKTFVIAGSTDNDTNAGRSLDLEEVLTAICIILLSFAVCARESARESDKSTLDV